MTGCSKVPQKRRKMIQTSYSCDWFLWRNQGNIQMVVDRPLWS